MKKGSLTSDVFERRKSTGSELFAHFWLACVAKKRRYLKSQKFVHKL